jgi:hypothetical protein
MASVERPLSAVLTDIVGNVQDIVRSEMRLARTEVGEEIGKSRAAAVWYAAGAIMLAFGALFLLLALVYALSQVLAPWAAALIVGAGVAAAGGLCIGAGTRRFKRVRAVPKTVASVKETLEWAKQQTR